MTTSPMPEVRCVSCQRIRRPDDQAWVAGRCSACQAPPLSMAEGRRRAALLRFRQDRRGVDG